jgi:hypothetical protein
MAARKQAAAEYKKYTTNGWRALSSSVRAHQYLLHVLVEEPARNHRRLVSLRAAKHERRGYEQEGLRLLSPETEWKLRCGQSGGVPSRGTRSRASEQDAGRGSHLRWKSLRMVSLMKRRSFLGSLRDWFLNTTSSSHLHARRGLGRQAFCAAAVVPSALPCARAHLRLILNEPPPATSGFPVASTACFSASSAVSSSAWLRALDA